MEWGYLIGILRCGELAPAQAPFLFVSGRLGSRPPVRKTNELGFGARTAGLKKGRIRPGRRKGSRPPVRKPNELGFGARTAGLKKDDGGPAAGRVRARLPAKPMNSVSEREPRAGVPKILFLRNLKKLFLYSNVILISRWYNYENE